MFSLESPLALLTGAICNECELMFPDGSLSKRELFFVIVVVVTYNTSDPKDSFTMFMIAGTAFRGK